MAGQGGPAVATPRENPLTSAMRLLGVRLPQPEPAATRRPWTDMPGSTPRPIADNILGALTDFPRGMITGGAQQPGPSWENFGAAVAAAMPFLAVARVPREASRQLVQRLAASWGGKGMPLPVTEAVEGLATRFPRMLSHIESIEPLSPTASPGTLGVFNAAEDGVPRIGSIQVDPGLRTAAIQDVLVHELTHGGQALRAADRGLEFQPMYAAKRQQHGYYNNPFEVRARIAENNQSLRESGILPNPRERMDTARMWAGDQTLPGPDTVFSSGPSKMDLQAPPAALEIVPASPQQFAQGVGSLNKRARAMTSVYSPEELSQMQLYMVNGANAGYALKNGDELVNVFNNGGMATFGRGQEIVADAVRRGARRLDCFDGDLVRFYEQNGFRVVRREPNWTPGEPDVVFMEWTGGQPNPTAAR